jgi:hypothetical protein
MSILPDLVRPFWLPGLHETSGRVGESFASWILRGDFQIYRPLDKRTFVLNISNRNPFIGGVACDFDRLAAAAYESMDGLAPSLRLPKSLGWLIIKCYYASFFAAHATLRMFGISCSQLDSVNVRKIETIADLFGFRNGINLSAGLYKCVYQPISATLTCERIESDGSHLALWRIYYLEMNRLSNEILKTSHAPVISQQVSNKLSDLTASISNNGSGSWLSQLRSRANYRHQFGLWYPYSDRLKYYDRLYEFSKIWQRDPMQISIWSQNGRDLQRFVETCSLVVAICRVLSLDMARRCPSGQARSFLSYGSLALLKRLSS